MNEEFNEAIIIEKNTVQHLQENIKHLTTELDQRDQLLVKVEDSLKNKQSTEEHELQALVEENENLSGQLKQ